MNFKSFSHLNSKNLVHGISKIMTLDKSCDVCIWEEINQGCHSHMNFLLEPFMPCEWYILINVCGPFEVPSLGRNKYFVSFVDEFIRMIWVTLIKFKHGVFYEFKKFKVKVEKQNG